MQISKQLNLVLRQTDEDENQVIAHHTPLPTAVYEAQWRLLCDVYSDVMTSGVPSAINAIPALLEAAKSRDKEAEANDLLAQIRGATSVYTTKAELLDVANISEDLKKEIVSKILFFIASERQVYPSKKKAWIGQVTKLLDLELTSSTATEVFPSSTISTTEEPTGTMGTSFPI